MAPILGIDVSVWQDDNSTAQKMDFKKAVTHGAHFVFIKASERGGIDPDFETNWAAAKDAGLWRGAYHFLRWDLSGLTQARIFCALLEKDAGDLPPVADFEAPPKYNGSNVTHWPSNALLLQFLEEVERILGRRPMIYTSPGFWKSYGNNKITGRPDDYWSIYPLWIAHYFKTVKWGVNWPTVPAPWDDFLFWQYTATGDGPAFGAESKGLDLDYFNGDIFALQELVKQTTGHTDPIIDPPPTNPPSNQPTVDLTYLQNQINLLGSHVKNIEDYLCGFKLP